MSNYVILTDSGCDIRPEVLKDWGVSFSSLTFKFDNDEREYLNFDLPSKEFYDRMRDGECAKTSAINVAVFTDFFKPFLKPLCSFCHHNGVSSLFLFVNSA